MTTLVRVPDVGLVVAGPTRFCLQPELDGRGKADPDYQLAGLMCLYARRLEEAGRAGEYIDARAEAVTRAVLARAHKPA